jgi:hypothetical protein
MRVFFKGNRVCQRQYGNGTILDVDERHTVIDFDEYGLRTFSTRLANSSARALRRRHRGEHRDRSAHVPQATAHRKRGERAWLDMDG